MIVGAAVAIAVASIGRIAAVVALTVTTPVGEMEGQRVSGRMRGVEWSTLMSMPSKNAERMMTMMVREERPGDIPAVGAVIVRAFDQSPQTPVLVDLMRARDKIILSYVAVDDGDIVGNVMFLPSILRSTDREIGVATLAPVGVLPERQNQGIGTRLVRESLVALRHLGHRVVFVLGHPEYYPRFGFRPAGPLGVRVEGHGTGPAFMVLELSEGALGGTGGELIYPPEFKESGL